ncbi:MAG TPA: inositol monophosphatase family protein [Methylomirabilota bacterium]|nr:inositol monophosphatase family protein [Methylomirabilota bacterium]
MTDAFREVAVAAARRAGALLRAHAGAARTVTAKSSPINLVTEIDRQAEALIVETIRARFPHHAVLGEEGGPQGSGPHRWIIDPIDGTTNFVHGLPLFSVSIGLEVEGQIRTGVVYDPNRDECFVAERGAGAYLGDRRLTVSATASLEASLLATGFPYDVRDTPDNNLAEYAAFTRQNRSVRELGSAALTLAWVAAGRLDGYWELVLGPWDVAAGWLLVEEAGGQVTTVTGSPLDLGAPSVVASNGRIHAAMLATLREVRS